MKKRTIFTVLLIMTITLTIRCSKDTGSDPRRNATPAVISVVSGNHQNGEGGETLAEPIVLRVTDSRDESLTGVTLSLSIVEGTGHVEGSTVIDTDEEGAIRIQWVIDSGYNGLEVRITDAMYDGDPCYVFAVGELPTGLHVSRTLTSLRKLHDRLYEITFYGDFSGIVEDKNRQFINYYNSSAGQFISNAFNCSVFSIMGDLNNCLFGRSFDNPEGWRCITMLCHFQPPDGYKSLVPIRTMELGYDVGTDLTSLSLTQRQGLLAAPFFAPDGINEHGLVVALADIASRNYTPDTEKPFIYKTYLIRKILDHARNVEEAYQIARQHNCFDYGLDVFSTHALVADPSGQSAVLELADGEMQAIYNTEPWQVATNSPLYNVSLTQARLQCPRFRYLYEQLALAQGVLTWQEGMGLLENVGYIYTQWSIMYNMTDLSLELALDFDFSNYYHFEFSH
jgi:hypothetical protein